MYMGLCMCAYVCVCFTRRRSKVACLKRIGSLQKFGMNKGCGSFCRNTLSAASESNLSQTMQEAPDEQHVHFFLRIGNALSSPPARPGLRLERAGCPFELAPCSSKPSSQHRCTPGA